MRTVLLLLLVTAAPALADTVWKWVDEKGVTHYSDRPVPGATKLEINAGSTWDSTAQRGDAAPATPASRPAAPADYLNFEIWKPSNGDTLANTGGEVAVEIRVDPPLQPGHTLSLYLDGKLVEGHPENVSSYVLKDVPRGLHSLTATVTDRRGNRLRQTQPVAFTVRQESIANPPVGPALRPPPKPQPRGAANKLPSTQPSYGALHGSRPPINPATNMPAATKAAPKPGKP